jgi:hypothetical protein
MMIYNYLFFKGYQLAVRSRNFDDMPVLGAIIFVVSCVMFNIFTVFLLLEGSGWAEGSFKKEYKFSFSLGLTLTVLFYYLYQGRYKKVLERYEQKERARGIGVHPVLIFVIYYGISFGLMLLAGIYKNGDWIFNK